MVGGGGSGERMRGMADVTNGVYGRQRGNTVGFLDWLDATFPGAVPPAGAAAAAGAPPAGRAGVRDGATPGRPA